MSNFISIFFLKLMLYVAFLSTITKYTKSKRQNTDNSNSTLVNINNNSKTYLSELDYNKCNISINDCYKLLLGTAQDNDKPKNLLALRKFGIPSSADFLFHLSKKWCSNYGNTMCLMDAELAGYEFGQIRFFNIFTTNNKTRIKSNNSKLISEFILQCFLVVFFSGIGLITLLQHINYSGLILWFLLFFTSWVLPFKLM